MVCCRQLFSSPLPYCRTPWRVRFDSETIINSVKILGTFVKLRCEYYGVLKRLCHKLLRSGHEQSATTHEGPSKNAGARQPRATGDRGERERARGRGL